MAPRPLLIVLVFALPILIVAFAVVMGGYAVAQAAGDAAGATALWWVAMSCAMLALADLILLAIILGLIALLPVEPGPPDSETDDPAAQ